MKLVSVPHWPARRHQGRLTHWWVGGDWAPELGQCLQRFQVSNHVFSDKPNLPEAPFAHMAANMGTCHQLLPGRNCPSHKCLWTSKGFYLKQWRTAFSWMVPLLVEVPVIPPPPSQQVPELSLPFLRLPCRPFCDGPVLLIPASPWLAQFLSHKYLLNSRSIKLDPILQTWKLQLSPKISLWLNCNHYNLLLSSMWYFRCL